MIHRISQLLTVAVLLLGTTMILSFRAPKVKQKEAIRLAEDFIRRNGYTEQPMDSSKHKLTYERAELSLDMKTMLSSRSSALHEKAYYISRGEEGWLVGFVSTIVDLGTLDDTILKTDLPGRTVIVPEHGDDIRMDPKDPLFSKYKKLK